MNLTDPTAQSLYETIRSLPIVSPHGHCDPAWFANDAAFENPADLLVVPDHYIYRMLYSQGVSLEDLGVSPAGNETARRDVFRAFGDHWHLFLGTPSRFWINYVLTETLNIQTRLSPETADQVYDEIAEKLSDPAFRPRALFERFKIETLATTDSALDDLAHHDAIAKSGWSGRVIPTFRPDSLINPQHPEFSAAILKLADQTDVDTATYDGYIKALHNRRVYFKTRGATSTDHAIDVVETALLSDPESVFQRVRTSPSEQDARAFHGHMLIVMAEMSVEDGLVMQLHAGSARNTNSHVFNTFGADSGADIPLATDFVNGLSALLNHVGNTPGFRLILFTLDESTYARELAPMAGHWPCLRIGPPWWFHDSPAGIARYFDQVVETAGYWNLAGFNDDTRAFLSIPARHDMWRRAVSLHLAGQVQRGYFDRRDAEDIAKLLAVDLARESYRL